MKTHNALTFSLSLFCFLGTQQLRANSITWADFTSTLPPIGTTTTVPLGGGSTVDILFQATPTPPSYLAVNLASTGAAETGLGYTDLYASQAFGGGFAANTQYTITFDNFVTGSNHVRGLFFVGRVGGGDRTVQFTATGGSVSSWTQVGNQFAVVDSNTYTWTPGTGQLTMSGAAAGGIVLDTGSLSSYTQIQFSLNTSSGDGWQYGFAEEVSTPDSGTTALMLGFGLLGLAGVNRKLRRA